MDDKPYLSQAFRQLLTDRRKTPAVKQNPARKRPRPFDEYRGVDRSRLEQTFSHLNVWLRVAARYDTQARNCSVGVILAIVLRLWIN